MVHSRRVSARGWPRRVVRSTLIRALEEPTLSRVARQLLPSLQWVPGLGTAAGSQLPTPREFGLPLSNGRQLRLQTPRRQRGGMTQHVFRNGLGSYEPEALPLFLALAAGAETVFDVGAHIGLYTLAAATMHPGARVFAFEPAPPVFDRLLANVTLNRLPNVVCVQAAAGDVAGRAEIFANAGGMDARGSHDPGHVTWHPGPWRCDIVPTLDLDQFAQLVGVRQLTLVKIDVEKAEPQVLRGMTELLRLHRPHVFCEVFPDEWSLGIAGEVEAVIAPLDYYRYLLTPEGPKLENRVKGCRDHLNHLLTPLGPAELEPFVVEAQRIQESLVALARP